MNKQLKKTVETILSFLALIISVFWGYLIGTLYNPIVGILGAIASFVIIALILTTIPKTFLQIDLFNNKKERKKKQA